MKKEELIEKLTTILECTDGIPEARYWCLKGVRYVVGNEMYEEAIEEARKLADVNNA